MATKQRRIFDAVREGAVAEMEQLVRRGAAINSADEEDPNRFTPLQLAANSGQLECLQWLLWYGADNSSANPRGWTAAHLAAIRGHDACLQALVNNGAGLGSRDARGCTPVHLASTHGHAFTLSAILRTGADANALDKNGWTPVHYATYHGRLGCLQLLVRWGGRVNEADSSGNTPFHLAATEGQLSCLKFLVCSTNGASVVDSLSARNDDGETPKSLAQQFYKDNVVTYISGLEHELSGSSTEDDAADSMSFPAHAAAYTGDLVHLQSLVEGGVVNVNERNLRGNTPLHRAAGQGQNHCVKWLVEAGADISAPNNYGETALDLSRRFAHLGCTELLTTANGDEDDEAMAPAREWARRHGHGANVSISSFNTSRYARQEAKARALELLKDSARRLGVSRKNYEQLGGRPEEAGIPGEPGAAPEPEEGGDDQTRLLSELKSALDYERIKREKLEAQLDECRGGVERMAASRNEDDGDSTTVSDATETTPSTMTRSGAAPISQRRRKSPRQKPASTRKGAPSKRL